MPAIVLQCDWLVRFLCRCQHIKYGSPAYRELSTLLWSVFRDRRMFRRDTLVALHLTRTAYLRRLRTYTAIFTTADWKCHFDS